MLFITITSGLQRATNFYIWDGPAWRGVDEDHTGHARVLLSGVQQGHSREWGMRAGGTALYTSMQSSFTFFHFWPEHFTVFITGKI